MWDLQYAEQKTSSTQQTISMWPDGLPVKVTESSQNEYFSAWWSTFLEQEFSIRWSQTVHHQTMHECMQVYYVVESQAYFWKKKVFLAVFC